MLYEWSISYNRVLWCGASKLTEKRCGNICGDIFTSMEPCCYMILLSDKVTALILWEIYIFTEHLSFVLKLRRVSKNNCASKIVTENSRWKWMLRQMFNVLQATYSIKHFRYGRCKQDYWIRQCKKQQRIVTKSRRKLLCCNYQFNINWREFPFTRCYKTSNFGCAKKVASFIQIRCNSITITFHFTKPS